MAFRADSRQIAKHPGNHHAIFSSPQLLATLGITKSHSRPHVSDDNPFSESQFKTMKYQPEFPDRFTGIDHGLEFCGNFIHWQNHEHHHWGLGLLTPAMVHYGQAAAVLAARQTVLTAAYAAHPERFVCHQAYVGVYTHVAIQDQRTAIAALPGPPGMGGVSTAVVGSE